MPRTRVLHVTDLAYEAAGRRYCDEDIYVSGRLREHFDVALCHPVDALALMESFDVVVVRNSGPVVHYMAEHERFRAVARERDVRVFNEQTGKADMLGKQYLVDLSAAGYPVIPTVDRREHVDRLPQAGEYVVKPKLGADSVGLRFVQRQELEHLDGDALLIQPRIDFEYEVSFYFVDQTFEYALYAPSPRRRWLLEPYQPTAEDLAFARRFIEWNTIRHGIQRVDACRISAGELLLVELEDLNPFLSLDRVPLETREVFVRDMVASIVAVAADL
jgi:hypothetical protein